MPTKSSSMPRASTTSTAISATVECEHDDNVPAQGSFDDVFTLYVEQGGNKKEYQVHCGLYSHHCLKPNHKRKIDANDIIRFPNDDPAIFDTVVHWQYTGRFWDLKTSEDGAIPLSIDHVLHVYFFGTTDKMIYLQRAALDLLYRLTVQDWTALISSAKTIYEHPYATAELQLFLLDFAVNVWGFDMQSLCNIDFPVAFLKDGLTQLKQLKHAPGMPADFDKTFAEWIKNKNETFCREYHHHQQQQQQHEDDLEQSDAGYSPRTIGRTEDHTPEVSDDTGPAWSSDSLGPGPASDKRPANSLHYMSGCDLGFGSQTYKMDAEDEYNYASE